MTKRYELKSAKYPNESIFVEYVDGFLSGVILPIKHRLNESSFKVLMGYLPYAEQNLIILQNINLEVIEEVPVNLKMKMFCDKYMEYHNKEKYIGSGKDALQLKKYHVTEEILDHYFTSTNFLFKDKHSIFNLTRYWNELKIEIGQKGKAVHPNNYSKKYADSLDPAQLASYWKHLRDLGMEAQKNRVGVILDWVKKVK